MFDSVLYTLLNLVEISFGEKRITYCPKQVLTYFNFKKILFQKSLHKQFSLKKLSITLCLRTKKVKIHPIVLITEIKV